MSTAHRAVARGALSFRDDRCVSGVPGARVERGSGATAVSAVTSAELARLRRESSARSERVNEHGSQSRGTRSVVDSR
jgi:hypothetical protein